MSAPVSRLTPELTEVAGGLRFPEGPVAMPDGSILLVEMFGQRLTLVVELQQPTAAMGPAVLEVRSGEQILKHRPLQAEGKWRRVRVADLPWAGDSPLVLSIRRRVRGANPEVLLDRAWLEWQ